MKRTFITGDEWLYYKLYSGPKTADVMLTEIIKPATEKLLSERIIDKWFFIRYSDPKQHIRLRFHYTNPKYIFNIIQEINSLSKPFIEQNLIWKVQLDSYQREIERYGENTMELAESLFFHDSSMIVEMLNLIEGDDGEKIRWLFSLRAIDVFLTNFQFNLQQKMDLLKVLADNFGKEFRLNSPLIKQLSNKFRKDKKIIYDILDRDKDQDSNLRPLFQLLNNKSKNSKVVVTEILETNKSNKLQMPLDNLLSSYIHMMMNRIFKSKQRLHEMVIYGFLFRYYKSMLAREKYDQSKRPQTENVNEITV